MTAHPRRLQHVSNPCAPSRAQVTQQRAAAHCVMPADVMVQGKSGASLGPGPGGQVSAGFPRDSKSRQSLSSLGTAAAPRLGTLPVTCLPH